MSFLYTLDGHTPVPTDDVHAWGKWFATADRKVAAHLVMFLRHGKLSVVRVSTVFIGINSSVSGNQKLFETMIFDGPDDGAQMSCGTWDEAVNMHNYALASVLGVKSELDKLNKYDTI